MRNTSPKKNITTRLMILIHEMGALPFSPYLYLYMYTSAEPRYMGLGPDRKMLGTGYKPGAGIGCTLFPSALVGDI